MRLKIINKSKNEIPKYATSQSAGVDLRAALDEAVRLKSMQRAIIPTGLFIELPQKYEAQIRPRSGLAAKYGITVLNSPGTIDPDYRGEIKVILINLSKKDFEIKPGDRIAQMIISSFEQAEWVLVKDFSASERGDGGFGSTGID